MIQANFDYSFIDAYKEIYTKFNFFYFDINYIKILKKQELNDERKTNIFYLGANVFSEMEDKISYFQYIPIKYFVLIGLNKLKTIN